ncbi:TRAP transporter small permease subunit [Halomonas eurihalina]|uniref:TRAP transporter small permease protein n=1 Tax=Halomonas eurihalina TaxID=42566 RepID=A0A5D9CXU1_HALER|nr:TRAP transporter small permease subunit [Halomonas eurihalina]MDR5860060.1 TRAP transporter small permease subunit [Halomonas eurihalina]TZG35065.1 TRAP transporter small permease subunit [Halomonas eurihalina]
MSSLARVNLLLERLLEVLTVFLLLALTAIVIAAVGFRMVGNSFSWYDEVASIGLAWLSFYGANLAALKRSHMGFPGLVSRAPAALRATLFILSEVIVIGFFLVIAYYGYRVLDILAWDNLVTLPSIGLDVTQSVIPISAVLFILCELLSMPMAWRKMRSGVNSEEEEIEAAIRQAEDDLKEQRA